MIKSPCKDCPDRFRACQDTCKKPERVAFTEEQRRIKEARNKEVEILWYKHEASKYRHRRRK